MDKRRKRDRRKRRDHKVKSRLRAAQLAQVGGSPGAGDGDTGCLLSTFLGSFASCTVSCMLLMPC